MQDCKDGSGLQFINFDFVTGGQESQFSFLWNFNPLSRYFGCVLLGVFRFENERNTMPFILLLIAE